MLEVEELVVSIPNRGTIVRRVTADEIRETHDVRSVLEGHAARLAASRLSAGVLTRLRRWDRTMKRLLERRGVTEEARVQELANPRSEFHTLMAAASGNRVLERTIRRLLDTPLHARAYFWYRHLDKQASFDDHEQMIELLATADPDRCERFWKEHLKRGRDHLIGHLAEAQPRKETV